VNFEEQAAYKIFYDLYREEGGDKNFFGDAHLMTTIARIVGFMVERDPSRYEARRFTREIADWWKAIRRDLKGIAKLPTAELRVAALGRLHDHATQAHQNMWRRMGMKDLKASCKAGCGGCCAIHTVITDDEAEVLASHVKTDEQRARLERLKGHDALSYMKFKWPERRCAFLNPETNMCTVYEQRPMACRIYQVKSDPALCAAEGIVSVEAIVELVPRMLSGALERLSPRKPMPEAVLEKLSTKG
jgi:Fe-S-cluster containining protein